MCWWRNWLWNLLVEIMYIGEEGGGGGGGGGGV